MFNGSVAQNVDEILTNPNIVAISDCSSNEFHHVFSTKALLHGKHVLCEKPIALTVEYAKQMIEAEKKTGKKLMIGHNQRFTKAHQKAKQIIERSEEHTSELQSRGHIVCRLLLEKKNRILSMSR